MTKPSKPSANAVKNPFSSSDKPTGDDADSNRFHRFERLEFTGTASAYFKIYFINILLTLVTLGLWVPWARVRRRRYFYSNTRILGDGIDYLATGFDLLKGWLLVIAGIILFNAVNFIDIGFPFLQQALPLLLILVYPWALNKSLQFNARNLVWRDVRFTWHGTYWGVFGTMFIAPLIGLLSLGLFMPIASRLMRHYIAEHYSFGSKRFEISTDLRAFYWVGIKTLGLLIGVSMLTVVPLSYMDLGDLWGSIANSEIGIVTIMILFQMIVVGLFLMTTTYYRAETRNLMVTGLRLDGDIRFRSEVSGLRLVVIVLQNTALIIVSMTLLLPWAHIRHYRYFTQNTYIRPYNDMTQFIDDEAAAGHSVGDAVSEAAGIEISL